MMMDINNLYTLIKPYLLPSTGLVGLVGGYYLHVFKSKYDKKGDIKYWARKLELDIISARETSKKYIDFFGDSTTILVSSEEFSNLDNIEEISNALINKLSRTNADKLFKFYRIIDKIASSQQKYYHTVEKFGNSRVNMPISTPETSAYARSFRESVRELNDYDINSLLDELKKYSK